MLSILTYNIHGLPWEPDHTGPIASWSGSCGADVLCFQEVFTETRRSTLQRILEDHGYSVYIPNDIIRTFLSSGLCIAVKSSSSWKIQSMQFIPFFEYAFWDSIANKGFFSVVLQHVNGKKIQIVNTHLQSDSELSLLYNITRIYYTNHVRTKQLEEIVKTYGTSELPTVIIGDLNQEGLIHPRIQNICCTHRDSIVTFPSTGENLDHAAWITGTGLLPHLQRCHVHNKVTHSDHSPIVFTICPQ